MSQLIRTCTHARAAQDGPLCPQCILRKIRFLSVHPDMVSLISALNQARENLILFKVMVLGMVKKYREILFSITRTPSYVREPHFYFSREGKCMLYHLNAVTNSFNVFYELSMGFVLNSGPAMVGYNNIPRGCDRCSKCFRHAVMASYTNDMECLCVSCIVITEWPEVLTVLPLSYLVFPISIGRELYNEHKTNTGTEMSNENKTFLGYYNCSKPRLKSQFPYFTEVIDNVSGRTHEEIAYELMVHMAYPRGNNHHFMMPKVVLDCLRSSMPNDLILIILRYILMRD